MEYSRTMKITAGACMAIALFVAWAACQASADQIVMAYFVALGILGIECCLVHEVFLTKHSMDGRAANCIQTLDADAIPADERPAAN